MQNKTIEEICKNYHLCNSMKSLPKDVPSFSPSAPPEHPSTHWTADIMKYGGKDILVAADYLSSFTVAIISKGESAEQLEEAIMLALMPFKSKAIDTVVRVDTAPGLAKLHKTEKLLKDGIKLDPGHEKNRNSCTKVDKIMSELRRELKTLCPEEKTLTPMNLARAISSLNSRTRHLGLSSREIMFQRDQQSNENIHLSDSLLKLKSEQLKTRNNQYSSKARSNAFSKPPSNVNLKTGSLVHFKEEQNKGSTRELYIVVDHKNPKEVRVRKLLHSLGEDRMSLRPKEYVVIPEKLFLAPNQQVTPSSGTPILPPFKLQPFTPSRNKHSSDNKTTSTGYSHPIEICSEEENEDASYSSCEEDLCTSSSESTDSSPARSVEDDQPQRSASKESISQDEISTDDNLEQGQDVNARHFDKDLTINPTGLSQDGIPKQK